MLFNGIAFGIAAIAALWLLFPLTEKVRIRIDSRYFNWAFWVLAFNYCVVQIVKWSVGWWRRAVTIISNKL